MIGQTLSHFKITAKLGEGGMGAVYRAEDTKLGRDVAIKVLPEEVAEDSERLARFEREAKVLASLNHSHIAAIYQVEQEGEIHFLVMELVEGEDLKQRLAHGPMELDEVLSVGFQVAEALEAAHEKGIVHRDLKPANVKVTPDGQVKVLDFGLAKALDEAAVADVGGQPSSGRLGSVNLSLSPTLTAQMTGAGVILGTAAYMSPEQARGKPVDKRADVWAFGVLLWEMLTAQLLFDGETVTDVIASVVTKDPDLESLPGTLPPEVERLLVRCLRKDPNRRLPDIGAARVVLQDVLSGTTPEPRAAAVAVQGVAEGESRRGVHKLWLLVTAALVAAGVAVGALLSRPSDEPPRPQAVHFVTALPEGWFFDDGDHWPVPSPTGDRVVFVASRRGQGRDVESRLWIRSLESPTALPLGGTEGMNPHGPVAWSPDGEAILFRTGRDLRILELANGTVRSIAELPQEDHCAASWNDSGSIIFHSGQGPVIQRVPDSGGAASPLTSLDPSRHETGHFFPQFLPDGNRFLFMVYSGKPENMGAYMASLDDPAQRQRIDVGNEWIRRQYAAGHLIFADQGTLFAQPVDLQQGSTVGAPVAVASSVVAFPGFPGLGVFGVSGQATVAYRTGTVGSGVQLVWRDREGGVIQSLGEPGDYGQIALSPDGRAVALEIRDEEGHFDLWTMDVARGVTSRVTATPDDARDPVWSSDSRFLAYIQRGGDGAASLRRTGLRTGDSETVFESATEEYIPESWSADGRTLMVVQRTLEDQQSIWALTEGEEPRPFVTPGFRVDEPQISPDGRWLAYVSPESERPEVYLEPFGGDGDRIRVSLNGGGQPKWRGDGRELFFVTRDGFLMAVAIGGDASGLEVGLPKELFTIPRIEGPGYDDYAVSADGERFLVKTAAGRVEPRLQIITNWTGLLD